MSIANVAQISHRHWQGSYATKTGQLQSAIGALYDMSILAPYPRVSCEESIEFIERYVLHCRWKWEVEHEKWNKRM